MLNSTHQFLDSLKSHDFNPTDKLVSFDVVSLFTNVPLNETINVIAQYVYSENSRCTPPFSKAVFVKLLQIATGGTFCHNDKLYKQVDGVAMGNPLGPTLANFFLAHIETTLFDNISSKPDLYLRYVDDIFAVFRSLQQFNHSSSI